MQLKDEDEFTDAFDDGPLQRVIAVRYPRGSGGAWITAGAKKTLKSAKPKWFNMDVTWLSSAWQHV
jgi:hypothetical protein